VLVVNIGVVAYLSDVLWRTRRRRKHHKKPPTPERPHET
jgi:hypothetical protein